MCDPLRALCFQTLPPTPQALQTLAQDTDTASTASWADPRRAQERELNRRGLEASTDWSFAQNQDHDTHFQKTWPWTGGWACPRPHHTHPENCARPWRGAWASLLKKETPNALP